MQYGAAICITHAPALVLARLGLRGCLSKGDGRRIHRTMKTRLSSDLFCADAIFRDILKCDAYLHSTVVDVGEDHYDRKRKSLALAKHARNKLACCTP